MANRANNAIRPLRIKKGDDLKAIYAKVKRSFTAADLQAFTEEEDGVPAEEVLAELQKLAGSRSRVIRPRNRKKA
jgi:hypothetical protein